jgi:hypothetical protein
LSEHTDNPQLEDEEMTRVIETDAGDEQEDDWVDSESEDDGWDDGEEPEELAPRPRGRLLRPLPLFLVALIVAAAGFLGGVLAQKGSEGGTAAAVPGGGSLPSFAAAKAEAGGTGEGGSAETGSESTTAGAATGLPSFGGGTSAAATGTVTSVSGHTIYVKESDGTVVEVKAGDGVTVTRDSNIAAKKIHPGDSVVVEGSKSGSTVKASSIAATESGVESTTGPGGAGAGGAASVESLFEE